MSTTNLLLASTMTPQTLLSGYVGTSDAAVYTCPTSSTVKIATAVVCNTSGAAATISVGVVKTGGTAGASHHMVHGYTLAVGDSVSLTPYLANTMLTDGDFITAYSGTASAVTMILTGTVSS